MIECVLGRSQASVCADNGKLIVAGGSNAWNCLNSVEMYCPVDNVWKHLPAMSVARRGAGMAVFKGMQAITNQIILRYTQ